MSPKSEMDAAPLSPAPRFATGWAALLYAIATLALAYPAFTGAFLVNPSSDQYIAGFAFRDFAASALRAGQGFPQWNAYLFGGMPYIAAMHGDIFYPTFLLRMILPTDQAMTWSFAIHLFFAGLFTFGFLRSWGVGFYGSLIGGLAYMLSGPIAAYASPGHDGKLFVSSLLPLALWMLVRGVRDGRAWAWGALAITVGLGVLSPHPQLLQYLLLASGAFALFLAFSGDERSRLTREVALKRLGLALGAVVLGALIGAIQYLPVREYVDWSPRAGGKDYAHAVSYSLPTEELLNAFVPQFSGILEKYWGRNSIHLHSEYPGVVVLVLAAAGMFAASARRGFRWFWMGTFVVSLLWALGGSTPFYRAIYAIVPGTKFFRAPSTIMYVTMFSIAVLAGLGTERVLGAAASIRRRFLLGWAIGIVALGLLFAAGLPMTVAGSVGAALAPSYPQYAPDAIISSLVDRARENQPNVLAGALRSIAFVLLALAVIWAAARGRLSARSTAVALLALVGADLWSVERRYWMFSPPAKAIYATDPAIEFVRAAKEPGRVLTLDLQQIAARRDPAFHDALMTHGIRLVTGYHGNELGRYQQLIGRGESGLNPQFWRHENVHYLYTTLADTLMPQLGAQLRWIGVPTKILGPVKNAGGSAIYLYRVQGNNPAAWVASAMVKGTDEQALATVLDPRFEPDRAAIIDTAATLQVAPLTTAPSPAGVAVSVTRYEAGRIDVRLDTPAPAGAALVVSENFFPGWSASADGRNAPVTRANYNLIGVALPTGAREVQLRYVDPAYRTGKTVTLIALALSLLTIAAGVFLDRRRPALAV